ncbi:hypothetical protein WKW80_28005 [Variovorax humicola]|uniref:Uncharacterized protein n=1 Tax=Variovorax humicola TaxID=1769758 RepID=A0ABU8W8Y0_9BURK
MGTRKKAARREVERIADLTIVPDNIIPDGLRAAVRKLKSPLVRQLVAFTRKDWSPLAASFLEVLQAQPWRRRPNSATVVG